MTTEYTLLFYNKQKNTQTQWGLRQIQVQTTWLLQQHCLWSPLWQMAQRVFIIYDSSVDSLQSLTNYRRTILSRPIKWYEYCYIVFTICMLVLNLQCWYQDLLFTYVCVCVCVEYPNTDIVYSTLLHYKWYKY
jgi:cell division protein FtsW (lipid II flippase)